jgi:hypothetical protein
MKKTSAASYRHGDEHAEIENGTGRTKSHSK